MASHIEAVIQPGGARTHAGAIAEIAALQGVSAIDVAVAYAMDSGVTELLRAIDAAVAPRTWNRLRKRWLISFDFLRTQPTALDRLAKLANSQVRVFDGAEVVARKGCRPRTTWHPKVFVAHGPSARAAIVGSANLSANGLLHGNEHGTAQVATNSRSPLEKQLWSSIGQSMKWFNNSWSGATDYAAIRDAYADRYTAEARILGGPTGDDESDADPGEAEREFILRRSQYLWIEAGNITRNRGQFKPGDQLMMSRGTRAFFGLSTAAVPRDTFIDDVAILNVDGVTVEDRPLRFSNNSMEVLTLPVPESPWPSAYDNETLLFSKVAFGSALGFQLEVGSQQKIARWKRKSRGAGTLYKMRGPGRQWGVFDN